MAQKDRILKYMEVHGSITQREAIYLGCYRLSARMFDMRAEGIPIITDMIEVKSTDGTTARIASYRLGEGYKRDESRRDNTFT